MNYIFLSGNAPDCLIEQLSAKGKIIQIESCNLVYKSIDSHADIFVFCCEDKIFIAKEQHEIMKDSCIYPFEHEIIESELGTKYPRTAAFNAILMGDFFIHKLEITSPAILNEMKKRGKKLVDVKQGYTRCSALPIGENSVITSDIGIAKTLAMHGIDVCLIRQGFIKLTGQEYGFIGGTGGRIDNSVYFAGDISQHPDYEQIREFICEKGFNMSYDKSFPLTDIGSILCLKI